MILHNFPDYINPKSFILIITYGNYTNFTLSSGMVFGIQYLVQLFVNSLWSSFTVV